MALEIMLQKLGENAHLVSEQPLHGEEMTIDRVNYIACPDGAVWLSRTEKDFLSGGSPFRMDKQSVFNEMLPLLKQWQPASNFNLVDKENHDSVWSIEALVGGVPCILWLNGQNVDVFVVERAGWANNEHRQGEVVDTSKGVVQHHWSEDRSMRPFWKNTREQYEFAVLLYKQIYTRLLDWWQVPLLRPEPFPRNSLTTNSHVVNGVHFDYNTCGRFVDIYIPSARKQYKATK